MVDLDGVQSWRLGRWTLPAVSVCSGQGCFIYGPLGTSADPRIKIDKSKAVPPLSGFHPGPREHLESILGLGNSHNRAAKRPLVLVHPRDFDSSCEWHMDK